MPLDLPGEAVNEGRYADGLEMHTLRAASRLVYRTEPQTGLLRACMHWARVSAHHVVSTIAGLFARSDRAEVATLDPAVQSALADHLEPDVRRLEVILDRKLPHWPAR